MIKQIADVFLRGINFARNNPQIVYTFFLIVAIPSAFFFASEQFLKVARENQDRLERNRIKILQSPFIVFSREHLSDSEYLNVRIALIAKENETINTFQVFGLGDGGGFPVLASMVQDEVGATVTPDKLVSFLLVSAAGNPSETFVSPFFVEGERHLIGIRAITATSSMQTIGYVVVELSMAQLDAVTRGNIRKAYVVLAFIILLIIILLARQARIIDYAILYKRLKGVDQMKDDFVSMAAHELRAPLGIIRGYADIINGIPDLSPENRENIRRIDVSAKDLAMLIDDILDVARIQEGGMSFTVAPVDTKALLVSLVESFSQSAHDKGLDIRAELPETLPLMNTDEKRMRQVLVNIIGNSIKYTPSGEVVVRASAEAHRLVIRVSDTGIGMTAEDQKKLFQKFYRVRTNETEDIRGTGLGLWITSQIIQNMKGKISVESIKGKGTDFIVEFPT